MSNDVLIIRSSDVDLLLKAKEQEIIEEIGRAYIAFDQGRANVPHSTFLSLEDGARAIALPAVVHQDQQIVGLKWISSFPKNIHRGKPRASGVVILNSPEDGRPIAFLDATIINAKRTAASAALCAHSVHRADEEVLTFIGAGVINFEILRFLLSVFPSIRDILVTDQLRDQSMQFIDQANGMWPHLNYHILGSTEEALASGSLISVATTAAIPHINDVSSCRNFATILHISLRDFAPQIILEVDNIVDDPDHVCRAQTSLHMAEQMVQHRSFIRATIGQIAQGTAPAKKENRSITMFSPFGLGALDISLAQMILRMAIERNIGTVIADF